MKAYPVTDPTRLERLLFDAGRVRRVPLAEIYDIKARTTPQQAWQDPATVCREPDVRNPDEWADKLHACVRGEFFAHVFRDCRKVLDLGCGEGWPSLYLARDIPEVVGLDCSPAHIALARSSARIMGLAHATFRVGDIEGLPFASGSLDGVCFGGNVFTYGSDLCTMLRQIHRVLRPGGTFAFEQYVHGDPDRRPWEQIGWFIDAGPPVLNYDAGSGVFNRGYFVFLDADSVPGRRMSALIGRVRGENPPEYHELAREIKQEIEDGALHLVADVLTAGEGCSPTPDEFVDALLATGLTDVQSWALPDGREFARGLAEHGLLDRLCPADMRPCLRALVRSAPRLDGWRHTCAACRKA